MNSAMSSIMSDFSSLSQTKKIDAPSLNIAIHKCKNTMSQVTVIRRDLTTATSGSSIHCIAMWRSHGHSGNFLIGSMRFVESSVQIAPSSIMAQGLTKYLSMFPAIRLAGETRDSDSAKTDSGRISFRGWAIGISCPRIDWSVSISSQYLFSFPTIQLFDYILA